MHITHFWGGQLFKATQTYQLIVGVTKELPSIEGFKYLRHAITGREHAMPVEIIWNNQLGQLSALARETKPLKVSVFCHVPQHCPRGFLSFSLFHWGPFLHCWSREWICCKMVPSCDTVSFLKYTYIFFLVHYPNFVGAGNSKQIPWKFLSLSGETFFL